MPCLLNFFAGRVIIAEINRQKLYSWRPKSRELELILDNGPGTIKSIHFDDHTNNLYWIDPINYAIVVTSLNERKSSNILQGNSSNIPLDLSLVPESR